MGPKNSRAVQAGVSSACFLPLGLLEEDLARIASVAAILFLAACFGRAPAAAEQRSKAPLADWQPREALQKKLEAEGWTVLSIRSDDGCYKVKAINDRGERLEGKYDPASLEPQRRRHEEDD